MQQKADPEKGELTFAREYMLEVLTDETSLFPYAMITKKFDNNRSLGDEATNRTVIGCDLAISTSASSDYSVFTVLELANEGYIVKDIFRVRGMSYDKQVLKLVQLYEKYKPIKLYVESNAFQRIFSQLLPGYIQDKTVQYMTGAEKHQLEVGIPSLRQEFEKQKIILPRGSEKSIEIINVLLKELQAFIFNPGKRKVESLETHDDTVMSLWLAITAARELDKKKTDFTFLDL